MTAIVALGLAKFAATQVCDFLLRFIGLSSMLYPVNDMYRTIILNSNLRTDAFMLAERVGGTTLMWGLLWMIVSLVIIALTLKLSFKRAGVSN